MSRRQQLLLLWTGYTLLSPVLQRASAEPNPSIDGPSLSERLLAEDVCVGYEPPQVYEQLMYPNDLCYQYETIGFTSKIALSGGTILSSHLCLPQDKIGRVGVFELSSQSAIWEPTVFLAPSTGANDCTIAACCDNFGQAEGMAIDGPWAMVGDKAENHDKQGSVFVYYHDPVTKEWTESQRLVASDRGDEDAYSFFGDAIAIDGNYAIIGNPASAARVYFFEFNGNEWVEVKLVSDIHEVDTVFCGQSGLGESVAISGIHAIAQASDSIEIYERLTDGTATGGTWIWRQTICDVPFRKYYPIALYGTTILAPQANMPVDGCASCDTKRGEVYIYDIPTGSLKWSMVDKWAASDGEDGDLFGSSVAISGNRAVVGAHGKNGYSGGAYIFEREDKDSEWAETMVLNGPQSCNTNCGCDNGMAFFGSDVDIDDQAVLVAASAEQVIRLYCFGQSDESCPCYHSPTSAPSALISTANPSNLESHPSTTPEPTTGATDLNASLRVNNLETWLYFGCAFLFLWNI